MFFDNRVVFPLLFPFHYTIACKCNCKCHGDCCFFFLLVFFSSFLFLQMKSRTTFPTLMKLIQLLTQENIEALFRTFEAMENVENNELVCMASVELGNF